MKLLTIGGGPAGAAAAITARQAGMEVTVLEEAQFPRARPGETLHPGIEPLLTRLGADKTILEGGYLRHTGIWVEWGARREFTPFGSDNAAAWRGFQAPRDDFDGRLLATAQQLGARVVQKAARAVIMDRGQVCGIETTGGAIFADFILDTSGSRNWLARQLGIPMRRHSPPLVAKYGYLDQPPAACERLPRIRADETGWTWIADLGRGHYLWTRVTEAASRPSHNWAPPDWSGATCRSRGVDVTWRLAARTAGPGWFLCGDAAAVLDPSSSHGVMRAIMSGMLAAHYAAGVLKGRADARDAAAEYHRWNVDWFAHDTARMAASYREVRLFGY